MKGTIQIVPPALNRYQVALECHVVRVVLLFLYPSEIVRAFPADKCTDGEYLSLGRASGIWQWFHWVMHRDENRKELGCVANVSLH